MVAQACVEHLLALPGVTGAEPVCEYMGREHVIDLMHNLAASWIAKRRREDTLCLSEALGHPEGCYAVQVLPVASRASGPLVERFREIEVPPDDPRIARLWRDVAEARPEQIRDPHVGILCQFDA